MPPSAADGGGRSSPWTTATTLAAAAGTALALAAGYVYWSQQRKRSADRKTRLGGPSLADEIKEALEREAAEAGGEQDDVFRDALVEHFEQACAWASSSSASGLSNDTKLALYGAYKQATVGNCPPSKPWGMESGLKWDAWKVHSGESKTIAMQSYIAVLDKAVPGWELGAEVKPKKGQAGMEGGLGPSVSTMGRIGQPEDDDIDETPVGQLCERIAASDVPAVEALLKKSPGLAFQKDKDGMTPLHWAADRGLLKVAELLLVDEVIEKGGGASARLQRINLQDDAGDTPLHYAVNSENLELARLLVKRGADAHLANEDGETALALVEGTTEWEEVLKGN